MDRVVCRAGSVIVTVYNDVIQQRRDVPLCRFVCHRRGNGTAGCVSHDNDRFATQDLHRVIEAADDFIRRSIPCDAAHKERSEGLIEDDFWSDAGVRASQDCRMWRLIGSHRIAVDEGAFRLRAALDKSGVAAQKLVQGVIGSISV